MPLILAIESSCDETAAAVVKDGREVLSSVVATQIEDEGSLYNYYRNLISIRHKYPAIARGNYNAVTSTNKNFAGFMVR